MISQRAAGSVRGEKSRMKREFHVRLCVQGRLACSAGDKTCRGKSQSPVVWIAEVMETETLKPIDEISRGEVTSHRAVTKVNALWPRK